MSRDDSGLAHVSSIILLFDIFYAFFALFLFPVIARKHVVFWDTIDAVMPTDLQWFAAGEYKSWLLLFFLLCLGKEVLIANRRVTIILNLCFLCYLFGLTVSWVNVLYSG